MRRPDLGSRPRHEGQALRAQTVGSSTALLYLIGFPQDGRNHAAPEVPAGVVVLLRVVGWNCRPELRPQVLIGAGHGAHRHSIQDEALLQPQGTRAKVPHPNHRSLRGLF